MGGLCRAQDRALRDLPPGSLLGREEIFRRRRQGLSALPIETWWTDPTWSAALDSVLAGMERVDKPEPAEGARRKLATLSRDDRAAVGRRLLSFDLHDDERGCGPYVAAALQLQLTRMASLLDPQDVGPEEVTALCPVCGSPPVMSIVHAGANLQGVRFLSCSMCGSEWHAVRIKCSNCASTKGIGYHEIEGQAGAVKAETCDECKTYLKIVYLEKDPKAEAMIDDLATVGLDVLVSEAGWQRMAPNPFLILGDT